MNENISLHLQKADTGALSITTVSNSYSTTSHKFNLCDGLCVICNNRSHCVWVENEKKYCEHYE